MGDLQVEYKYLDKPKRTEKTRLWIKLYCDSLLFNETNGWTKFFFPPNDAFTCLDIFCFIHYQTFLHPRWREHCHLESQGFLLSPVTVPWACLSATQMHCKAFGWLGTTSECVVQKRPCHAISQSPKKGTKILREGIHNSKNYGWWNLAELAEECFIFLKRFFPCIKFSPERTYLKLCCSCMWLRT